MSKENIDISDDYMLTTLDNPWNPFTQFDAWFAFDLAHGYDTCGTLARFAATGNELTEEENSKIISQAMDDIINVDPFCRWIKVSKKSFNEISKKLGKGISGA